MTAQDQMRKMLDQLMGQDRDGKKRGQRFLARFSLVMHYRSKALPERVYFVGFHHLLCL